MRKRKRKDFEIRFYEKIVKESPNFFEGLSCLASCYTKRGFYREGLEIDKRLSLLKPADPIVFYNLACSYSLVGEIEESLNALKKALILGYTDFSHLLQDPDLSNLRKHTCFEQLLEKIADSKIKVASKECE